MADALTIAGSKIKDILENVAATQGPDVASCIACMSDVIIVCARGWQTINSLAAMEHMPDDEREALVQKLYEADTLMLTRTAVMMFRAYPDPKQAEFALLVRRCVDLILSGVADTYGKKP